MRWSKNNAMSAMEKRLGWREERKKYEHDMKKGELRDSDRTKRGKEMESNIYR